MTANRRDFLAASSTLALSAAAYSRVLGANDRLGIGFIGYGLIAKTHVATFKQLTGVDLLGVAEVHRGRLAEGLKVIGNEQAKGHADFRQLLDDKRIHGVLVATPDHWHALATMLACAAGKDVYVEKPLTLFVKEGEWMQTVAKRTGRIVQVGTQQRSGKHYQRARELIRGGHLGKITSVRMASTRNIMPGFGAAKDEDPPAELDWNAWLGPAPKRAYNPKRCLYHFRWIWDYAGGQMTNLGAHHLDIVDWILGLESLKSVNSIGGRFALDESGETPDTQDAQFEFDRWNASFTMRECAVGSPSGPGLEFFGTKGSLTMSRSGFTVHADRDSPSSNMIPGIKEGHPAGGPKSVAVDAMSKTRCEPIDDKSGSSPAQYLEHARNFLDCIRSRKMPISDLESADRTAVLCHLANLSLRLGRKLRWDFKTRSVIADNEANAMLVRPYRAPWDKELATLGIRTG